MATGTVQHAGFTLMSTDNKTGVSAKVNEADTGTPLTVVTDRLNKAIGDMRLFFFEQKSSGERPAATSIKVVDGYADLFVSGENGMAVMGDLGLDLFKLENPHADVGVGFRMDTGINIGNKGARIAFFGLGGELVYKEEPAAPTDESPGAAVTSRISGLGAQFGLFKVKVLWD